MPERIVKLKSIIRELESELRSLDSLDDDARQLLQGTVVDLHQVLGQTTADPDQHASVLGRLQAAEERYHLSHPTLSGLVVRIIDALGQLGI